MIRRVPRRMQCDERLVAERNQFVIGKRPPRDSVPVVLLRPWILREPSVRMRCPDGRRTCGMIRVSVGDQHMRETSPPRVERTLERRQMTLVAHTGVDECSRTVRASEQYVLFPAPVMGPGLSASSRIGSNTKLSACADANQKLYRTDAVTCEL